MLTAITQAIRRTVPMEAKVARRRLRRDVRHQRRLVRSHLAIPSTLARRPRVKGSVWAVSVVRDEEDVIGHVVSHLLNQAVDEIIVADNGSTDSTRDILMDLAATRPLHLVDDTLPRHYQGTKMTILAEAARGSGADWIIPFDADELWFAEVGILADYLRSSVANLVRADVHNVFPSSTDDTSISDPFARLHLVDTNPLAIKTAFRTGVLFEVGEGNHDVSRSGPDQPGLFIAHYPWRSFQQLRRKVRQGAAALHDTTALSEDTGASWKQMSAWSDDQLQEAWHRLCSGEAVEGVFWSPQGRLLEAEPSTWRSWSLAV